MSGFAGMIHTGNRPIDPAVLDRVLPILEHRGPDGSGVWLDGGIGLCHSRLRIADDRPAPGRSFVLSGNQMAAGDIRLDAPVELAAALSAHLTGTPEPGSDLELFLAAFRRWGENCPDHLAGDFSAVLWDRNTRELFCVRDHFGIRPFYYGVFDRTLVFSNTFECIVAFEKLTASLDESVIGEYLLAGQIQRLDRTPFSAIRRLPPGHCMHWSAKTGLRLRRYWALEPARERMLQGPEVLEQFEHRMSRAIEDRLPAGTVRVLMSGGLDSTCVAAFAAEASARKNFSCDIRACTFGFDRLIQDEEPMYAKAAADALGISLDLIDCDKDGFHWTPQGRPGFCPEPVSTPPMPASLRTALNLLTDSRLGLSGQGADPALHSRPRHAASFFRSLLFGGLAKEMLRYRAEKKRFPRLGLRSSLRGWLGRPDRPSAGIPPWIRADFADRLDLNALCEELGRPRKPPPCLRSEAYRFITDPFWASLFEHCDAGATGIPAQLRHPFFDLRVMAFLLSLPPVPWCIDKEILRRVLSGRLPEKIVQRPKAPLSDNPLHAALREAGGQEPVWALLLDSGVKRFVDLDLYLIILQNSDKLRPEEIELVTRPLGLAWWLLQDRPRAIR